MKKNKAIMALTISMAIGTAGCSALAPEEEPAVIYGPPSAFETTMDTTETQPATESISEPSDLTEYQDMQLVYGPPPAKEEDTTVEK